MGLKEYRRKRRFRRTSEPRGRKASKRGQLYVVQKHAASHLHYDFRLELDGVLKSWAVPKGPSLDPSVKRLAVEVEDHPVDYGDFEGTIPEGEYGGGTVMLWDRGSWEPLDDAHEGLREGKLKFRLHGEKLAGNWMLVRTRRGSTGKPQWLLFKERDEYARPESKYDIEQAEPLSVASGRDLDEIAAAKDRVWSSSDGESGKRKADPKTTRRAQKPSSKKSSGSSRKHFKPLPKHVGVELATLVKQAPEGEQWFHEIKFDGYRLLAFIEGDDVRLETRNELDWTAKFPELAAAVGRLGIRQAIFDGEVVALNKRGVSEFQGLQEALSARRRGSLIYYVFDLLWLDGEDLRPLPLEERQARLDGLGLPVDRGPVRLTEHVIGNGPRFFAEAEKLGLEGIISKLADRPYKAARTRDWLKVKCQANEEFVIGGYTDPAGARHGFGALLLGYYEKPGKLRYAGRVGTGFSDALLESLSKQLKELKTADAPFIATDQLKRERHAHWVRPTLVAQVRFANWTRDGLLRQPAFLGLREDKPARSVHRDVARNTGEVAPKAKSRRGKHSNHSSNGQAAGDVRLTHPDKILYPDANISKRDLVDYYQAVGEWMLPHVADRPLAIVRCPDGVTGHRFFQKHPTKGVLESLKHVPIEEKHAKHDYVVISKVDDLAALVQIGALELHVWGSRADAIEHPDRLVFDLDPAPEVAWKRVVTAAREIRQFLQELGLESFVKTTGGKGLHLVVPIERRHEWEFVGRFCHAVATAVERAAPEQYIATMSKAKRAGKIYVDYLRNQRGATSVAPYSTRSRPGAPVSMPLSWDELGTVKSAAEYTVVNARRRLAALKHDPWAKMGDLRQNLKAGMLKQLEA